MRIVREEWENDSLRYVLGYEYGGYVILKFVKTVEGLWTCSVKIPISYNRYYDRKRPLRYLYGEARMRRITYKRRCEKDQEEEYE